MAGGRCHAWRDVYAIVVLTLVFVVGATPPAFAPEECHSLTIQEPEGDTSGVEVATHPYTSTGQLILSTGGSAQIRAPELSDDVHTRIVRSVAFFQDLGLADYIEWGWLRDPGLGNIEFFWARKVAGVYTDDRSDVYTYSSRTAKIESAGGGLVGGTPEWRLYVGSSYKGAVAHQFNTGVMSSLAERWNSCDPNEAKLSALQHQVQQAGAYQGWPEMQEVVSGHPDPAYGCKKGLDDTQWWTVRDLTSHCTPDLDPL